MSRYVSLVQRSDHSILEGYGTIDEYIKKAKDNQMSGLGLCDMGSATGLFEFVNKCLKNDLKPLPGITFYMSPNGATSKEPDQRADGVVIKNRVPYQGFATHLNVFAYNAIGLQNLYKLSLLGYRPEHLYRDMPRIDVDILKKHHQGLVVLSGDNFSELVIRLAYGEEGGAREYIRDLQSVFKNRFFIEIIAFERISRLMPYPRESLLDLAKEMKVPIIITANSYFANREDRLAQNCFMSIKSHKKIMEASTPMLGALRARPELGFNGQHFLTEEEVFQVLPYEEYRQGYDNGIKLLNLVDTKGMIDFDPHLKPVMELPEGETELSYFEKLIEEGFQKKRAHLSKDIQEESKKRIELEKETIHSNGFISYFLIVRDFLAWGRKNGCPSGAGRGSVGGSEIAYLLNISETDPIRHDLLFERFLSPGRGTVYLVEYEDGTTEEMAASDSFTKTDGTHCYGHELEVGDEIVL